jgi:hypothetical protein
VTVARHDTLERTCWHEAGHAVIHTLLGNTVSFVTVCNRDGNGMVNTTAKRSDADLVIGGYGGFWSEKLFLRGPVTLSECSEDFRMIDHTLGISSEQDPRVALREELKARSREMVLANKRQIRAVADFLCRYESIGDPAHSFGETATEILHHLIVRAGLLQH